MVNSTGAGSTALSFSVAEEATIMGGALIQDYVYIATGSNPSVLTLSNVTSIPLYTTSQTKVWASSNLPAAPTGYPAGSPPPNLKITLTFAS